MKEFGAILKARKFIRDVGVDSIPVNIDRYAKAVNATVKVRQDLGNEESGQTFQIEENRNIIVINGNHSEERQRFTILHEIAHIYLELPSNHHDLNFTTHNLLSYQSRPKEEIYCDVFAAECLLPKTFFERDVETVDISFNAIKKLAKKYKASITSTGSRFAEHCDVPCAFILMERGKIRYVSMSEYLRELNCWIRLGGPIPKGSVADQLSNGCKETHADNQIATDIWFSSRVKNFNFLTEEAILLKNWDQCLSLIWFEDDLNIAGDDSDYFSDEDESMLAELDGILSWSRN